MRGRDCRTNESRTGLLSDEEIVSILRNRTVGELPPFPPPSASWRTTSRSTRNCKSNCENNLRCYRLRLTKYCEFMRH